MKALFITISLQMLLIDKDHKVDGKFQVAQIGK